MAAAAPVAAQEARRAEHEPREEQRDKAREGRQRERDAGERRHPAPARQPPEQRPARPEQGTETRRPAGPPGPRHDADRHRQESLREVPRQGQQPPARPGQPPDVGGARGWPRPRRRHAPASTPAARPIIADRGMDPARYPPISASAATRRSTGNDAASTVGPSGPRRRHVAERRDDVLPVELQLLLLVPVHEVEVELVDAGLGQRRAAARCAAPARRRGRTGRRSRRSRTTRSTSPPRRGGGSRSPRGRGCRRSAPRAGPRAGTCSRGPPRGCPRAPGTSGSGRARPRGPRRARAPRP